MLVHHHIISDMMCRIATRCVYRFGVFTLKTVYEGRPAYIHTATGQAFFYKSEFDKWDYWHKLEAV